MFRFKARERARKQWAISIKQITLESTYRRWGRRRATAARPFKRLSLQHRWHLEANNKSIAKLAPARRNSPDYKPLIYTYTQIERFVLQEMSTSSHGWWLVFDPRRVRPELPGVWSVFARSGDANKVSASVDGICNYSHVLFSEAVVWNCNRLTRKGVELSESESR